MRADPLKLGFIGGGIHSAVGATHFIASQMDGRFKVEAGCFSRHEDCNTQTGEQWKISSERRYRDWRELRAEEQGRLDAIVVLTPTPDHQEPVLAAVGAGYPVVCEKALATSSADASEIRKALAEHRGFLAVTYNYTGYPMVRELRNMLTAGRLGRVQQIHIEMPQEGYLRRDSEGEPRVPQQWRPSGPGGADGLAGSRGSCSSPHRLSQWRETEGGRGTAE